METTEQRQRQQEEEEEEEVVEETEALQGRPPRHPNTTTIAATSTTDSNVDAMLTSAETANGFQEQEYQEEELQNGNEDKKDVEVDAQERSERNVYYDKDEGSESIYGFPVTENSSVQGSVSEKNPGDDELVVTRSNFEGQKIQNTVLNQQYTQKLKDDSFSGFRLMPSENSFTEHKTFKSFSEITVAGDDTELIKASDQELTELDLERVLEKQDTHDLYCPNCNSCITRRVILRKRKCKIRISGEDAKRNRLDPTNDPGRNAVDISLDGNPTPTKPKIFRCLSCFSIFFRRDDKDPILLLPKPVSIPGADLPTENGQNVGVKLPTSSTGEDENEEVKVNVNGSDTIIIVQDKPVEPEAPQEAPDTIASAEPGSSPHTGSADARQFQGLDVIKSIVYGGLIESITSLSIVSSAAGADAATLNIFALGLANLIGGLFIIGHNLWELKNEVSGGASNQATEGVSNQLTEQVDKYQELLGRRENFLLHATVAVLSFLIFGLLPPVIYGFSFRVSDNRDFKLIAVAVASLLCIIVLATGKTYVQRPPKAYIKTVMDYVITGFMASGVSYAAGDLIKELLQKLGWFNSGSVLTLPILETPPMHPAWESY